MLNETESNICWVVWSYPGAKWFRFLFTKYCTDVLSTKSNKLFVGKVLKTGALSVDQKVKERTPSSTANLLVPF